MKVKLPLIGVLIMVLLSCAGPASAALGVISRNPYLGAIVIDAATGKVLFEDNADARSYPASVIKLMVLLIVLEEVEAGRMTLDEPVRVTSQAAAIGGSQVYLREGEVFSVDDLLYALIVESANDAAVALAIHHAGSKAAFVELMNKRAQKLGMNDTVFHSVHGLPPGRGQLPDVSTPRDIAKLCRALLRKPDALRYTSTKRRSFRTHAEKPFIMVNHNKLLKGTPGCDGLKTGYFRAGGFSIAATAMRQGKRAIVVVLGAENAKVRNARAKDMLTRGLEKLSAPPSSSAPAAAR